ncbi:hypothetical protein OAT16_05365 [Prolixibacteraceae bacterium]|nr:hypothetical protein [Prolixibacteraceae bacterium]
MVNGELSIQFEKARADYLNYTKQEAPYDTLMIFKKNERDTLIHKDKATYLEPLDPNVAYYLHGTDTIIGGNGFCLINCYLLKEDRLAKLVSQEADCVESGSYTRVELCIDTLKQKHLYMKDVHEVWDESEWKKGYNGIETEVFAMMDSSTLHYGIKKKMIYCHSESNRPDTIQYEIMTRDDISYWMPRIEFGYKP